MTTIALHRPPSLGTVFRAYCRSLFIAYERVRVVLAVLAVLTVIGFVQDARDQYAAPTNVPSSVPSRTVTTTDMTLTVPPRRGKWFTMHTNRTATITADSNGKNITRQTITDDVMSNAEIAIVASVWITFAMVVAWVLAFRTWRGEPASRRVYHWAMPVERGKHVLVRVLAGWMLLVAMFLTLVGFLWVAGGSTATIVELIYGGTVTHALQDAWVMTSSEAWLAFLLAIVFPIAAATTIYLLVSVMVVAAQAPGYWIGGIIMGYLVLPWVFRKLSLPSVGTAITQLWAGHLGLGTALFGTATPLDFAGWWPVSLLWIGVGGALLVVSAVGSAHAQQR